MNSLSTRNLNVKKVPNDHQKPYCTCCMTEMSVGGLAETALDIHTKGKKHSFKCPAVCQSKIMFTLPETENEKQMNGSIKKIVNYRQQLIGYCTETRWALESWMSNYSYNSCSSKSELFSAIFSNSDIAEQFSLGKAKCVCTMLCMELLPILRVSLLNAYNLAFYSVSFDESYTDAIKRCHKWTCSILDAGIAKHAGSNCII